MNRMDHQTPLLLLFIIWFPLLSALSKRMSKKRSFNSTITFIIYKWKRREYLSLPHVSWPCFFPWKLYISCTLIDRWPELKPPWEKQIIEFVKDSLMTKKSLGLKTSSNCISSEQSKIPQLPSFWTSNHSPYKTPHWHTKHTYNNKMLLVVLNPFFFTFFFFTSSILQSLTNFAFNISSPLHYLYLLPLQRKLYKV